MYRIIWENWHKIAVFMNFVFAQNKRMKLQLASLMLLFFTLIIFQVSSAAAAAAIVSDRVGGDNIVMQLSPIR